MIDFVPFLIHSVFLLYFVRSSYHKVCLSNFILLLHTLSMLSYGILATFSEKQYYYTFQAYFIMLASLIILLIPLRRYEHKLVAYNISGFTSLPKSKFNQITFFLIVLGLYASFFFLVNITSVIAYGFNQVRQDGMIFYKSSMLSKIAILGAFTSPLAIFFAFYNIVKKQALDLRTRLLLLSSLSFILYTLNVAGRDGIVIWFLSFIASLTLFYPFVIKRIKRKLLNIIMFILVLTLPLFLAISFSRFGSTAKGDGVLMSFASYLGQPLANLSYSIDFSRSIHMRSGEGSYPLEVLRILFLDSHEQLGRMERINSMLDIGFRTNQFSSYIGAFYPAYPFYVLIIFILLLTSVFSLYKFRGNLVVTSRMLIVYGWYMVLIIGVFYFYYSEISGNVYLLLPFIFYFLFKIRK